MGHVPTRVETIQGIGEFWAQQFTSQPIDMTQPPHPATGSPSSVPGRDQQYLALLDALGAAVWRCDASRPIPTSWPPERMLEELHATGRVGYCNFAHARLHRYASPAAMLGLLRSTFAPPVTRQDVLHFQRFVEQGFHLTGVTLRTSDRDGQVCFLRATWLGVIEQNHLVALWTVLEDRSAERELEQRVTAAGRGRDDTIIGESPAILQVQALIGQVAHTEATVLIRGETGTGKELIARAIHQQSRRHAKPLITVNCGAISPSLVESELFGHEKGAFTGALARKAGRFELADGGTLFLDEIGDLPLDLQVKLLRVLQEGELMRVGGNQAVTVDVRVIAATHRDLPAMVQRGEFRQDLYYRLNVFPLTSPPLRERPADIPLLARHFAAWYSTRMGKPVATIADAVLDRLAAYPWPGNIRELANLIERSVIVSQGSSLQLAEWVTGQYRPVVTPAAGARLDPSRALLDVEREHIRLTLVRTGWKVSGAGGAAEVLGLQPTTLEARMKKLGIARPGR